jgi:peptide/nickel transport system substrate-binding protein
MEKSGVRLITTPGANDERYTMNADAKLAPLFADKNLRKALQHAVDKKTIVDKLLYGTTVPGVSEWGGSPWEHKSLPAYTYDPAKAKQMLDGLGWKPGPDGIRVKDGKRLSFKHATTVGNLQRENVQLLVQQMFKDVGVEMVIENKRTAELFGTFQQNGVWSHGTYEMGGWSHGLRVPDPEVSSRYLCREIATASNPAGAQWYHYCNPEVDKLLLEQAKEFDAEKRKATLLRVQEILHDDAYWIWLYRVPLHYTARSEIKNFVLHPFANFYFNPHEWEWA